MTKKSQAKVKEDNLTIRKILDKEELKDFANQIVSEDIDNIILIYRDTKDNSIRWASTIRDWAMVLGSIEMVHMMMAEEWANQHSDDEEGTE